MDGLGTVKERLQVVPVIVDLTDLHEHDPFQVNALVVAAPKERVAPKRTGMGNFYHVAHMSIPP